MGHRELRRRLTLVQVEPADLLIAAGLVSSPMRELRALLPRYERNNLFDRTKFKQGFWSTGQP